MKPDDGRTDPQLLAAYLDGEFEGRDGVDDQRRRIERWLETDAEARQLARDYRGLRQTWNATAPPEPAGPVWRRVAVQARKEAAAAKGRRRRTSVRRIAVAAALVAGIVLGVFALRDSPSGGLSGALPGSASLASPPHAEDEIFPVAQAEEVAILQVDGRDISTLVVGTLPVQGALELVGPEEVDIRSMEPASDGMAPQVRIGARSPTIWAKGASD